MVLVGGELEGPLCADAGDSWGAIPGLPAPRARVAASATNIKRLPDMIHQPFPAISDSESLCVLICSHQRAAIRVRGEILPSSFNSIFCIANHQAHRAILEPADFGCVDEPSPAKQLIPQDIPALLLLSLARIEL